MISKLKCPSTQEAEEGVLLQVWGQFGLHSARQDSQCYTVKTISENKQTRNFTELAYLTLITVTHSSSILGIGRERPRELYSFPKHTGLLWEPKFKTSLLNHLLNETITRNFKKKKRERDTNSIVCKAKCQQSLVSDAGNSSPWEAGTGVSVNLRPAWPT